MVPSPISAKELEQWMLDFFRGDPAEARSYCEQTLSPNFYRTFAGGDVTDFERAVEKVTRFRTICKEIKAPVVFLVQEGNQMAAMFKMKYVLDGDSQGDNQGFDGELMFMGVRDEQGRYERVWELGMPWRN